MDDRSKSILSIIFLAFTFTMPFVGLAGGWAWQGVGRGSLMALIIFIYFLLLSVIFLALIKNPSWLMVALPFCIGVLYMTTPDPILGGLDDALVMGVMSWITFLQWHKKAPGVSWWVIVPLMGVAVYELVGGLIPGPLDEMIVAAFGAGIAVILGTNIHQAENFMALSVNDVNGENNQGIIIEGKNDKGLKTNTKEVIEQTFEP